MGLRKSFLYCASTLALGLGMGVPFEAAQAAIDEIVVTAQRRAISLQDVAVSATVLTADDLDKRGVIDLLDLQLVAPGLNINNNSSANVLNIRGIGRSRVDVDIPSGVQIYRDGAPTLAGYFQNEPYYDIESVEILRGPQGTIAGKSASGGAIFINTKNPVVGEWEGFGEIGAGALGLVELTGAANVPLGDKVAVRVAYHGKRRDDFHESVSGPFTGEPDKQKLHNLRVGLNFEPNEKWQTLLKISMSHLDFGGDAHSAEGLSLTNLINQAGNFDYIDRAVRSTLENSYTFDNGITATSLTSYTWSDTVRNTELNGGDPTETLAWFKSRGHFRFMSQEFNLVGPEEKRLRWVLGVQGDRQESTIPHYDDNGFAFFDEAFNVGGFEFPWLSSPWFDDQNNVGVFANTWFDIVDSLELELGVRYSYFEREQFTEFTFGTGGTPPTIPFGSSPGGDTVSISENSVDWKVALNWSVTDNQFLYGLVSRGHTTGGINIFPPNNTYEESGVINYELGWKGNLFDDSIRTQVAGYYETFKKYQGLFSQALAGASAPDVRNATDTSTFWGIEASAQATFGDFGFDLAVNYLDTELQGFGDSVVVPGDLVVAQTGFAASLPVDGNEAPFAPNWTFNAGVEYNFHVGDSVTVTPRVDFVFIDEVQTTLFQQVDKQRIPSYDLLNFRVGVEAGPWYGSAFVTNVLDDVYLAGIQNDGELYYPSEPRLWGARIGRKF